MNRITFPRKSYRGETIKKRDLIKWYTSRIETEIQISLNNITTPKNKKQKEALAYIKRNLHSLLTCSPRKAERLAQITDTKYKECFQRKPKRGRMVSTKFGKSILKAFNYNGYRKTVLLELAEKLNIKSCPYCNMHYTLFAETDRKVKDRIAKLQFDHFFGKAEYPFLSMSLFNLIPSCGVCNQGKSSGSLSLSFHPYVASINDQFHFEVDNAAILYFGGKQDIIEIKIISDGPPQKEVNRYEDMFNIRNLYRRHKDIVQEIFDKEYLYNYYRIPNFSFISPTDKEYLTRLWTGVYPNDSEIEKRPMSKFINDIRKQAKGRLP